MRSCRLFDDKVNSSIGDNCATEINRRDFVRKEMVNDSFYGICLACKITALARNDLD